MSALDSTLRSQLDGVCQKARDLAEAVARSALQKRAVDAAEPFPHFTAEDRSLRNRLRARGRQLGDVRRANKTQGIDQLTHELAYEYWHRMLFARFLAENHLLMHPDGVAVSLAECDELAASEGAANGFVLAARYASKMLPQIFRTDDVLLEIDFPVNDRLPLEKLLNGLPCEVFTADDSLGWVYQFWQTKRKKEVNDSGEKIDGRTLPAVTQLFTEHYMVQFLLHNTIGAWWCARHGIKGPPGGAGVPAGQSPVEMEYLRWRDDGTPAAGTFDGWPKSLKEFKMLDPCCGSGHFLVAAFNLLVPLRMHDEGLTAREACDAVLRENLFGLELDPRCTQIAAFALAVAAWKFPNLPSPACGRGAGGEGAGGECEPLGFRELPPLNIACTGIGPQASEAEWLKLAEQSGKPMSALSREPILNGLRNLYALFSNAPTLGSLIDPNQLSADLITADYETLQPYLAAALTAEHIDDDAHERAVAAAGMVKAAELLAGEYTLVATNVPYLGYRDMDGLLLKHVTTLFPEEKGDVGYCLWRRFHSFVSEGHTIALVTLQHWLSLRSYTGMRRHLLTCFGVGTIAHLGTGAFETISGAKVNVTLTVATRLSDPMGSEISLLDAGNCRNATEKAECLKNGAVSRTSQKRQFANPDHRISFGTSTELPCLSEFADCLAGIMNGDSPKFIRNFWELPEKNELWAFLQSTVSKGTEIGGLESMIFFDEANGHLREDASIRRVKLHNADERGNSVWGRSGVAISQMSSLPASRYFGNKYDSNVAAIVPKRSEHLPAIWAFCSSDVWYESVRAIDRKLNVTNATFGKVPFDQAHWQRAAAEKYPNGLPEPESDDPTQWLFHGYPGGKVEAASRRLAASEARQDAASTFGFLDREAEIENLSGNLPHWRQEGVTYFVTFRTADSIPQAKLQQWLAEREAWLKAHPQPHDAATRREYGERFLGRFHEWLDAGYGACVLARPDCRAIVEEALRHFAGQRYVLDEFVVMPNHVHVLTTPLAGHSLSGILHSWKSYTSKEINKVLGQSGTFWQKESFDHILRSPEQLEKVRQYIRDNPKGRVEAASRRLEGTRQDAASTLQVAVARLLGYRWPAELDDTMRLSKRARALVAKCGELARFADNDGIVSIPSVRGEPPAAERVLELLHAAYGPRWSSAVLHDLLTDAGCKPGATLDDWLRSAFFEQHCKLFHNRPFVWHIWDGHKDGFSCLVNYHKLDYKTLENLTHSYLRDWIAVQAAAAKEGKTGADLRLAAAQGLQKKLELILQGEEPYDIFVRWKPLHEQPIGWNPDLNDGVRMNIRPFVTAGVLRKNPNIKWTKDRGKEPERDRGQYPWFWKGNQFTGERVNDVHLTIAEKQAARKQ